MHFFFTLLAMQMPDRTCFLTWDSQVKITNTSHWGNRSSPLPTADTLTDSSFSCYFHAERTPCGQTGENWEWQKRTQSCPSQSTALLHIALRAKDQCKLNYVYTVLSFVYFCLHLHAFTSFFKCLFTQSNDFLYKAPMLGLPLMLPHLIVLVATVYFCSFIKVWFLVEM